MVTTLPKRDVVIIGMGWTGAIMAKEMLDAGLSVVGLERGPYRHEIPDFQGATSRDELKYHSRYALMMKPSEQTLTFRNSADQTALPYRRLGSFLPGKGLGGAGVHWNGQTYRFLPYDFAIRSATIERYGEDIIDEELTIQDWPVSYEELEPHYDHFEKVCGISGKAGNLRGEIVPGGNPFEGPRSDEYPTPPMKQAYSGGLFERGARAVGAHPFRVPSANLSQAYTNPYGCTIHPCTYCGYCQRFGCGYMAKSTPQLCVLPVVEGRPGFELRTEAWVQRIVKHEDGRMAAGVTYIDADGEEYFQPADIVFVAAFSLWNAHLLMLSGIGEIYDPRTGEGQVGKNYTYQTITSVTAYMDEEVELNPFAGAGALGTVVDDWNGDNFDHSGLGFIHGGYIATNTTGGRPIMYAPTPPGTPAWGAEWKRGLARTYNHAFSLVMHGASMAARGNHLDLDPTYRDMFGNPLMRMTYDFPENDKRMAEYTTARAEEIARATGAREVSVNSLSDRYSIVPYQTTHNNGGTIMGHSPADSVTNRYGQTWACSNVFVTGAGLFPQNGGYNPTDTVGALAYFAAKGIRAQYLPDPGPMVDA
jgi:gluconate 2-dehydrogenase alpha chain